jgi:polyisoprenoid-binding protein YceI
MTAASELTVSRRRGWRAVLLLALSALFAGVIGLAATEQPVDTAQSTITIRVFKSGFLSGLGDDHEIRGTVKSGTVNDTEPAAVHLAIDAAALRVIDPRASAKDRADVQTRMLGPDVLDASRFPEIVFDSDSAERAASGGWLVHGKLTLHGQTRPLSAAVVENQGHYKGSFALKQSDFGITPIKIAGGAVKVKDEITIDFDVVAGSAPRRTGD